MAKILETYNYGVCLFSMRTLQNFIKQNQVNEKRLLRKLQNDKELYLTTQKEGVFLPIVDINSGSYIVKIKGYDQPFDNEWELKLKYNGFNLLIEDGLCICDIGMLRSFNPAKFSEVQKTCQTLNHNIIDQQFQYPIASGKYLIAIEGYAHKQASVRQSSSNKNPTYGFLFSLIETDAFIGFKNPREDALYEFNIGWLASSKEATVYWLTEENERKKITQKNEYSAGILLEDGDICHLYMRFDRSSCAPNDQEMKCRVDFTLHCQKYNDLLSSKAEHILYKESRTKGKKTLKKVAKIVIS